MSASTARTVAEPTPCPPIFFPGVYSAEDLRDVESKCVFQQHQDPHPRTSFDNRTEFSAVPADLVYAVQSLADGGGALFGLDTGGDLRAVVLRYTAGFGHDWHADRSHAYQFASERTVSFSVLLNEPGQDFTGGEFETEFGPVDLHAGDAVLFTAETQHRVAPVTAGARLVIVCFAERAA